MAQSENANDDDIALLTSAPFDTGNETTACVTLTYNMKGATVGRLAVYVIYDDINVQQVWEAYGDQGTVWNVAHINVIPLKPMFKFRFLASRGHGNFEFIAIKNVTVRTGACVNGGNTYLNNKPWKRFLAYYRYYYTINCQTTSNITNIFIFK